MNAETAFWEIIRELGSSPEELNQLQVQMNILEKCIINLVCVKLDSQRNVVVEEQNQWNFHVVNFHEKIDLRDPDSFRKIEDYINKVRSNRLPITEISCDVRVASDNPKDCAVEPPNVQDQQRIWSYVWNNLSA